MDSQGVYMVAVPIWIAIPVLVIVVVGGWKLVKLLYAALSN